MGLDAVEFVLALEDAVGLDMPDEAAAQMLTPRAVVDYLEASLPAGGSRACFSRRAFFRIRSSLVRTYAIPRRHIRPAAEWDSLLPTLEAKGDSWATLKKVVGVPDWPHRQFLGFRSPYSRTVGDTAAYLGERVPHAFKAPSEGWSRAEFESIVATLINNELGIPKFRWDDWFVKDLGVN